jgi:hypothetical protein
MDIAGKLSCIYAMTKKDNMPMERSSSGPAGTGFREDAKRNPKTEEKRKAAPRPMVSPRTLVSGDLVRK